MWGEGGEQFNQLLPQPPKGRPVPLPKVKPAPVASGAGPSSPRTFRGEKATTAEEEGHGILQQLQQRPVSSEERLEAQDLIEREQNLDSVLETARIEGWGCPPPQRQPIRACKPAAKTKAKARPAAVTLFPSKSQCPYLPGRCWCTFGSGCYA